MKNLEEEFKVIPGCDGDYYMSNLGNAISCDYHGTGETRLLKPQHSLSKDKREKAKTDGKADRDRLKIIVYRDKKPVSLYVHKLVAELFIPNPNNYPQVHHIDGNHYNNRADNLMWVTAKMHRDLDQSKRVACYDSDWNVIKVYKSVNDVEQDGFWHSTVCNICNNKPGHYTHRGYRWRFITEDEYIKYKELLR